MYNILANYLNSGHRTTSEINHWNGHWSTELDGMSINCDGDGYTKHDIISGNDVYVGVNTEKCQLTSTDWRYTVQFSQPESTAANNQHNGGITCADKKREAGQYGFEYPYPTFGTMKRFEPDVPSRVLNICYLPTDNAASGLGNGKGTFTEIRCSDGEQLDNGDWIVPKGAHCTAYCEAPYRFESTLGRWTCTQPVPTQHYQNDEWHKMMDDRSKYFDGNEVIPWGFTSGGSNFLDNAHQGCKYKIASGHETCPTPDLMEGETDTSTIWDCDDGFESGSKCIKRCDGDLGWKMIVGKWNTPKVNKECYCKGTCKWKGTVNKCSRAGCSKSPNVWSTPGPSTVGAKCETAGGQSVDYATAHRYSYRFFTRFLKYILDSLV